MMHQRLQELGLKASACQPLGDRLNELQRQGKLGRGSAATAAVGPVASKTSVAAAVGVKTPAGSKGGSGLSFEELLRQDPYLALTGVRGVTFK